MVKAESERRKCLSEFMNKKWMEFYNERGRGTVQADLARELGISEQNLSYYMRAPESVRVPRGDTLLTLARHPLIGPEVYDVLGIPREFDDDPRIRFIVDTYNGLSPDDRDKLLKLVQRLAKNKDQAGPTASGVG